MKLGEISQQKDKIEFLESILNNISFSLSSVKINEEEYWYLSIESLNNLMFLLEGDEIKHLLKFYVICDVKDLFQIVGRYSYKSLFYLCFTNI